MIIYIDILCLIILFIAMAILHAVEAIHNLIYCKDLQDIHLLFMYTTMYTYVAMILYLC